MSEDESTDLQNVFREFLGRSGRDNAQRILNILIESPFFYRDDDVDLFGVLWRNANRFRRFFETFFGWDLYIDRQVARLVKPVTHNPGLTPSQRHVFRISGRDEYVLFTLLLEFHLAEADRQNVDLEQEPEVRFILFAFIQFVFRWYKEQLGESAPAEEAILKSAGSLFRKLEQYRFIAVRERQGRVAEDGLSAAFTVEGAESVLYALLPGLRCYRPEALNEFELFTSQNGNETNGEEAEENQPDEGASAEDVRSPDQTNGAPLTDTPEGSET